MKTSLSFSSALTWIVIAVLIAAVPFAIAELFRTGEIYMLSKRFIDDLAARFHGHGRLRFIIQPITAIILGARDGAKDARTGRPPFFWGLLFQSTHRGHFLHSAIASVCNLVAVSILADVVAQFLILGRVNPFAALLLGPILISLPYASSRGLTNRLTRLRGGETVPNL